MKSLTAAFAAGAMAVGLFAVSTTETQASTCNILNFTTSTACISPVSGGPGGNATAETMNAFGSDGAFGTKGWMLLDEVKREGTPAAGTIVDSTGGLFSITYQAPLYKQGLWALNPLFRWGEGHFAFVVKGATDNAAYKMDVAFTNGTWSVNDLLTPNGKNVPDMSNIRLFGTAPLAPIPLPPVAFMLLGALGALVVASRRRRTA
jgi:hypothetical protein